MKAIGCHFIYALVIVLGFVAPVVQVASAQSDDSDAAADDHLHHHHSAEFAKVPERARLRNNPLASDPEAVAAGKKLFSQHCAECHGKTAEGRKRAPDLRAHEVQAATPGTLFWILTNGVIRRGMPVWSKLPEPERWQIVTFIKSLPPSPTSEQNGARVQIHSKLGTMSNSGHRRRE